MLWDLIYIIYPVEGEWLYIMLLLFFLSPRIGGQGGRSGEAAGAKRPPSGGAEGERSESGGASKKGGGEAPSP